MEEEDVLKFLAVGTHLGGTNLDFQMEQYIHKRNVLKRTWEKLLLTECAVVIIENTADISVISSRNTSQRAVLKSAVATGATHVVGHFALGIFLHQMQAAFREPRNPVVTDSRADHQPFIEMYYVNLPTTTLLHRLLSALCGHCHLMQQYWSPLI